MKKGWKILICVVVVMILVITVLFVFRYSLLGSLLSKEMKKRNVPGVSMTLIEDNSIKWSKSYGIINNESRAPVNTETLFQAASVTKMMVAALALHCVENGMIDLDRNINDYLTSWKLPDNQFTKEQKVTLRLLLSHRAGLPDSDFPYEEGHRPSLVEVLNGKWPAQNKPARVEFRPGSQWQYSNMSYVIIQMMIEDVCRKPVSQLMQEVVFEPLHMGNSTLTYPLTDDFAKRDVALPHDENGKEYTPNLHPIAVAQGGVISTPEDIAKFLIELMRSYQGESDKVISQSLTSEMFHEECSLDPDVFGGIPASQGLGVFIVQGEQFYILSVGNNAPGSTCWAVCIPQMGKGAVVMTNGFQGFDLSTKIIGALLILNHWPMPQL